MAGIFDNEKDGGILGRVNDFFYKDSGSSLRENISNTLMPPTSEILNRLQTQQQQEKIFTPNKISNYFGDLIAPAPASNLSYRTDAEKQAAILNQQKTNQSNNNATVPNPKGPDENTFLGAVGEYFNTAKTNWKDKGGFNALMSKPEFGIGLSLLQQASEGKTIGASALKAMVDGGVISEAYAKKIAAKGSVTGPATAAQIEAVKAKLAASGLAGKPTYGQQLLDIFKGESTTAKQDMAYAEIYKEAEKKAQADAALGKKVNIDDYLENAARDYIATNKGVVGGSGFGILGEKSITKKVDTTKQKIVGARQLGGPVAQGKAYLVGEVGPEVFIPKETGKIVSTDDSKIINLLLESNPQLKNVSPARAEKILRNRFPDYFE